MAGQTFGPHGWSLKEESIDRLPSGMFSVGVGADLVRESGIPPESIVSGLEQIFDQLIDGGANVGFVEKTRCYFRRRAKAVDIGTRRDFEELGWAEICDACDDHTS